MLKLNMDFLMFTEAARQVERYCFGLGEEVKQEVLEKLRVNCEKQWIKRKEDLKTATYHGEGWIVDEDPGSINIDNAFIWDETEEGHVYWNNISKY
ncbi:hypothetical protein ORF063 [Pseudomonas phage PA11]|uniref:hypothetical protein ORF063 n=1 Tax=Pseudomonas phage PA11 TaxID=347327 RepID=UPI00015543B9|nr:hypothetical protein ORF063 [Pseudomonas phage PA11]